jgi:hypothetical protein
LAIGIRLMLQFVSHAIQAHHPVLHRESDSVDIVMVVMLDNTGI